MHKGNREKLGFKQFTMFFNVKQTTELNVCWNMVFREIFRYNKWESVRAAIDACDRIDIRHLISVRKILLFYRRIFYTNTCVLRKLFCTLLSSIFFCIYDSCMMSIFPREAAQKVYAEFRSYLKWLWTFILIYFILYCIVFYIVSHKLNFCLWRIKALII